MPSTIHEIFFFWRGVVAFLDEIGGNGNDAIGNVTVKSKVVKKKLLSQKGHQKCT